MKGYFPFIPRDHIFTRLDEGHWHAQDCGSESPGVGLASYKKNDRVFHMEVYFSSHVKDVTGRGSSHSVGLMDLGSSQSTALDATFQFSMTSGVRAITSEFQKVE